MLALLSTLSFADPTAATESLSLEDEEELAEALESRAFSRDRWESAHRTRKEGLYMALLGPPTLAIGAGIAAAMWSPAMRPVTHRNRRILEKGLFTFGAELGAVGGIATLAGLPVMVVGRVAEEQYLRHIPRSRGAGNTASVLLYISASSWLLAPVLARSGFGTGLLTIGTLAYLPALICEARQIHVNRVAMGGRRLATRDAESSKLTWTVVPGPGSLAVAGSW